MRAITEPDVLVEVERRLTAITPESQPAWGSLTPVKLMGHLGKAVQMSLGELDLEVKSGFLQTRLGKWMIIDSPLPWPKGVEVPEQLLDASGEVLESARAHTIAELKRFCDTAAATRLGLHPVMGELTLAQWARLHHRHFDHHLRQFGV